MGIYAPKTVSLPHASTIIFSLPVCLYLQDKAVDTWSPLQSWNSAFMESPCLCQRREIVLALQLKLLSCPCSQSCWRQSSLSLELSGQTCNLAVGRCWWHLPRVLLCLAEKGSLLQPTSWRAPTRQHTLLPLNE